MSAAPPPWPVPTSDERTMAVLAQALQIVGGWIAPLVIFLVKKDSLFVRFHALQALMLHIAYLGCAIVVGIVWFAVLFGTIFTHAMDKPAQPPVALMIMFPIMWLVLMGGWLVMIVMAIVYAVKASNGEWAEYPVLGRMARRFLKMDASAPAITPGSVGA
jgi:uncharacterized protein